MNRALFIIVFLLLHLQGLAAAKPDPREGYLGDDACRSCHTAQVDSFHQTAHYLTSALPNQHSILGQFKTGENILKTSNPNLSFRMEAKETTFTQTAVAPTRRAHREIRLRHRLRRQRPDLFVLG
jgi:hypothetical protein